MSLGGEYAARVLGVSRRELRGRDEELLARLGVCEDVVVWRWGVDEAGLSRIRVGRLAQVRCRTPHSQGWDATVVLASLVADDEELLACAALILAQGDVVINYRRDDELARARKGDA